MDPNSVAVIILNWNKADLTIPCVMNIKAVEKDVSKRIIVVDNGSNDSTREELLSFAVLNNWTVLFENELPNASLSDDNDMLILLNNNYGYAKGNNFGLKLAYQLGHKYALISNNDVVIEQAVLEDLLAIMERNDDISIIGPAVYDRNGKKQGPFKKPTLYKYFFYPLFSPVIWPIKKALGYASKRDSLASGDFQYVYSVMGCFMLVRLNMLKAVDWFDENTFLYAEELILSEKLERAGYKVAYKDSTYVKHMHGGSSSDFENKTIKSVGLQSELYYLRNYRNYGSIKLFLAKVGINYMNFVLVPVKSSLEHFIENTFKRGIRQ